ncbi:MAG: GNAT family N-acetyltransferase [Acidobacteriota bacterium]
MINEISVRFASVKDAGLIARLAETTFRDAFQDHPKNAPHDLEAYISQAFTQEQIGSELADSRNVFMIAEIGGEAAGYAKLTKGKTEPGITARMPIELSRLYSHQKFLGKGVGQRLLEECFRFAGSEGFDVIWLGVWEYNPRARRFYEKNGFRYVGSHIFQLGTDAQTDLLMQKEVFH